MNNNPISRRTILRSSILGMLTVSLPNIVFSKDSQYSVVSLFHRYPAIDDNIVAQVVGASHANLEKLKGLADHRPELARATWDWGFGDWETAIGAASHVGRRDIAEYLIKNGARPDIFTYAMLGSYDVVKAMIDASPGVQTVAGPHGITLLQHVKNGLESDGLSDRQKAESNKLISYLTGLGNADGKEKYLDMTMAEKDKYIGVYMYGDGPEDGFNIKYNLRKLMALGRVGKSGGALYKRGENEFVYNGTSSVKISFLMEQESVVSMTIQEPDFMLTAKKV